MTTALVAHPSTVQAEPNIQITNVQAPAADPGETPVRSGVFSYGFKGGLTGLMAGASVGYLLQPVGPDRTRSIGQGSAWGLVAGAGLGLGLGLWELDRATPGLGYYATRDAMYGSLFGAAVGTGAGGILALSGGEGQDVADGLAWGTLLGAGAGLLIGVADYSLRAERPSGRSAQLAFDVAVLADQAGERVLAPSVRGSF